MGSWKALEALILPMDADTFLREHWGQRPAHVTGGGADKFESFPGVEQLLGCLAGRLDESDGRWTPAFRHVNASGIGADGQVRSLGAVPLDLAGGLYNAGFSLGFAEIGKSVPALRALARDLVECGSLGAPVGINAYLTPPNSGSAMHYDSQHVFLCQRSGEKHWRVSDQPALPDPLLNGDRRLLEFASVRQLLERCGVNARQPDDVECRDLVLQAGDVLYLPPGHWHMPRTGARPSLHYTVTFTPACFWTLLQPLVNELALRHGGWRRDLRFAAGGDGRPLADVLQECLNELRGALEDETAERLVERHKRRTVIGSLVP